MNIFFLHFAHVKMNVKHASLSGKAPAMNFLWGFFFLSQCTMDPFYPVFWSFFFDSYLEVLSGIRCCFSLTRLHDHFVFGECTAPHKLNKAKYRAFWPNNRTHTYLHIYNWIKGIYTQDFHHTNHDALMRRCNFSILTKGNFIIQQCCT